LKVENIFKDESSFEFVEIIEQPSLQQLSSFPNLSIFIRHFDQLSSPRSEA
jgi:hypothetical protein